MLSPPKEVRPSCELEQSETLTTKGDRGMNSKESLSLSMHVLWVNPIQVELAIKLYLQPCHIKTTIN